MGKWKIILNLFGGKLDFYGFFLLFSEMKGASFSKFGIKSTYLRSLNTKF